MSLRGVKPTTVKKRLKALMYGDAGVGKTTVTLSFPAPYLIDTEDGATYPEYTDALDRAGGAYFATSSFDEIVKEVRELMNARHNYRTLIIDSVSVVYDDLCTRTISEIAARGEDPMAFQRYRQEADRSSVR